MKSPLRSLFLGAAVALAAVPALAQTNVSISVGQPGFYGRLDIGDFGAPPPVYIQQPVIVREVRHVRAEPIYLRVPPGHRKNWSRHCSRYNACARPVMFVRDDWYTNTYAPRYREIHHRPEVRQVVREEVRYVERPVYVQEERQEQRQEQRGGHGHGHGHGGGHGNGKGHGKGH